MPLVDKEEMIEYVSRASACGLPSSIHAIGDKAVHDVLDVFERVRQEEAARGEPIAAAATASSTCKSLTRWMPGAWLSWM